MDTAQRDIRSSLSHYIFKTYMIYLVIISNLVDTQERDDKGADFRHLLPLF